MNTINVTKLRKLTTATLKTSVTQLLLQCEAINCITYKKSIATMVLICNYITSFNIFQLQLISFNLKIVCFCCSFHIAVSSAVYLWVCATLDYGKQLREYAYLCPNLQCCWTKTFPTQSKWLLRLLPFLQHCVMEILSLRN